MNGLPRCVFARLTGLLRDVGPFAAIGLLLPGGSLIALLLWIFRRRASIRTWIARSRVFARSTALIGDAIRIPSHM